MPKAGTVAVSIRPVDAGAVARWLQSLPPPLWGVALSNVPLLSNGVRVSMFDQLQSFADRKRKGGGFGAASIGLLREDAEWLAAKVQRGMFGTSHQKFLPAQVVTVCRACAAALAKRSGRPKYRLQGLDAAIVRQNRNVSDPCHPVDPRWMKRLRQRKKRDEAMAQRLNAADGLWGGFLSSNSP
jgi:hypothetical protein